MNAPRRLLCVLAHPDDESFGAGGVLAKYAREGAQTYVVLATRGEHGRHGSVSPRPSMVNVGRLREEEARQACAVLGVHEVSFLGLIDGEVERAGCPATIDLIADHVRRVRPQVVITFPPDGGYGHPDHVAVCKLALAAVLRAATADDHAARHHPHVVTKLYYIAWNGWLWDAYQAAFGAVRIVVDAVERRPVPFPDWAVTTVVDTAGYCDVVWQAVQCHRTQVCDRPGPAAWGEHRRWILWGEQRLYRALSLVDTGRGVETDLFAGIGSVASDREP
jgi:LmbE family N-acetylglucosaminyl deacetylase